MLVLIGKGCTCSLFVCVVSVSIPFVAFLLPRFLVPPSFPFILFLLFPPLSSPSFPFPFSLPFPFLFPSVSLPFPFRFPSFSLPFPFLFPSFSLPFPFHFHSATFPTRSLDDNVQPSLPDCLAAPAPLPGAAGLFTFTGVAACT